MANTTNYNWETPDDTDLVKDGAAAIRTLGSSVDTTTKALNPSTTLGDIEYRSATANTNTRLAIGTTGQVLTVAAGVPSWATSDDANAIQNAIVDAKGDIVAASAADTPARLAVGTDNHRLIAASGETTGLKYVADTQNTVIDSAGDLLYGTAADTVARLGIGTAGQVLKVNSGATAPEWGTAASGGGMTLLSTTTLSGASTTVSSIDQTYVNLLVFMSGANSSGAGQALIQSNASATGSYGIQWYNATQGNLVTNISTVTVGLQDSMSASNTNNFTSLLIQNYASSTTFKGFNSLMSFIASGPSIKTEIGAGVIRDTSAITSMKFQAPSGTWSAGTVLIYGVK